MFVSDHFISLTCNNCGGKLDVYDDMERFACGYCGSEMLVQRRGGTVALKDVTEAIKQVQAGTDKTAAELAIIRYQKELSDLQSSLDDRSANARTGYLTIVGVVLGLIGLVNLGEGSIIPGSIFAILGCLIVFWAYSDAGSIKDTPTLKRIAWVREQMAKKKRIVES